MAQDSYYTPGVCNINQPEIAYRKKAGHLGAGLSVIVLGALIALHVTPVAGLAMFFPVFLAAIGYLQATNKFCVSYAASGVYNVSDEYADTAKIVEEASRKLDKQRARKINAQAALIGLAGAAVSYAILAVLK